LLSLAAGTVLDVGPAAAVDVAAESGFPAVGLWFDPGTWTGATTAVVDARLRATGVTALDIEPVILGRGPDHGEALVDTAAELGVAHVLVASGPAERSVVVERLAALCERAAPAGVTVVLEFLPIFSIGTLADALAVVDEVARSNAGVLVDTLHLARSGGGSDDLRRVSPDLVPYLQIADAPATLVGDDRNALREEALHGRLLPGDGELPLEEVLLAVPSVPLSLELRSRALVETYPEPVARARAVLAATQRLLDRVAPGE
jgi:sugar phosphate isomerase/epimerase